MIDFKQLREKKLRGMPPGEHVFDKRVKNVRVMIHKDAKGFTVYIDGDKLDTFRSKREAQKAGMEFAKELSK